MAKIKCKDDYWIDDFSLQAEHIFVKNILRVYVLYCTKSPAILSHPVVCDGRLRHPFVRRLAAIGHMHQPMDSAIKIDRVI